MRTVPSIAEHDETVPVSSCSAIETVRMRLRVSRLIVDSHGVKKPSECYQKPNPVNLPVVLPKYLYCAAKLCIPDHPPLADVLESYRKNLPTKETIGEVYKYLCSRIGDFKKTDWTMLAKFPLVFCKGKLVTVDTMFFRTNTNESKYDGLLDMVDALEENEESMQFLSRLGVKMEPTTQDLVHALKKNHEDFLEISGLKKYFELLLSLCAQFDHMTYE